MIDLNFYLCISTVICTMATLRLVELCNISRNEHPVNISRERINITVNECINVQPPSYTLNDINQPTSQEQNNVLLSTRHSQKPSNIIEINPPSYIL